MNKFLKNTALFMIPILLVSIGMDYYMRTLNSTYKMKIQALEKEKDNIELIILGNSHACFGVDPSQFQNTAINLANSNQSIYYDKRIVLNHIDQLPKLKYVLISLDYHSLNFSSQGIRNLWSFYGTGIQYKEESTWLKSTSPFLFGYGPKFSFQILLKQLKNKNETFLFDIDEGISESEIHRKDFIPYIGKNDETWNIQSFKNRANHFNKEKDQIEYIDVYLDLVDFIKTLKDKGITPILFSTPTYGEYNTLFTPESINEYIENGNEIARNLDIQFWEYAFHNEFQKEFFFNCDHLNEQGAKEFGKLLNQRLKEIAN